MVCTTEFSKFMKLMYYFGKNSNDNQKGKK